MMKVRSNLKSIRSVEIRRKIIYNWEIYRYYNFVRVSSRRFGSKSQDK